jgi:hypothetical protein
MGLTIMITSGGSRRKLSWDNPDPFNDGRAIYEDVLANPGGYTTGFVTIKSLERAELWWSGRPGSTIYFINPTTRQTHWQTVNPNGGDAGVIFYERGLWLYQYRSPLGPVAASGSLPPVETRLNVSGVVDNHPRGTAVPVVFGTGIWKDANDSTYGWFGYSHDTNWLTHGELDRFTGTGTVTSVSVHFRASATGDNRHQPLWVEAHRPMPNPTMVFRFYGGASTGAAADSLHYPVNWDIPNDGVVRDYSIAVDTYMLDDCGYDTIAQLGDNLKEAGNYLCFQSDSFAGRVFGDPHPVGIIRIQEAWLTIETSG